MRSPPRRLAASVLAMTLLAVACGGDDDGDTGDGAAGDEPVIAVTGEPDAKPEFTVPREQEPPPQLVSETVFEGVGAVAEEGDTVVVHYVGKTWSTGEQFDASWDRDDTFPFKLGAGSVIQGWEEGVAGMRVGERRTLIIPPEKGYGKAGAGGLIGPDETLVFVVDLVEVR